MFWEQKLRQPYSSSMNHVAAAAWDAVSCGQRCFSSRPPPILLLQHLLSLHAFSACTQGCCCCCCCPPCCCFVNMAALQIGVCWTSAAAAKLIVDSKGSHSDSFSYFSRNHLRDQFSCINSLCQPKNNILINSESNSTRSFCWPHLPGLDFKRKQNLHTF